MGAKVRIDMTGVRHGRLVGVAYAFKSRSGHAHWRFACDCGRETIANGTNVRGGGTTSCGCVHREISALRLTVHGHRAKKRHDITYKAWQRMNDSCSNPASPGWSRYGAEGVTVCPTWRADYCKFLHDMGERPPGAILTRFDPNADFERSSCYWAPARSRSQRAVEGHRERARAAALLRSGESGSGILGWAS